MVNRLDGGCFVWYLSFHEEKQDSHIVINNKTIDMVHLFKKIPEDEVFACLITTLAYLSAYLEILKNSTLITFFISSQKNIFTISYITFRLALHKSIHQNGVLLPYMSPNHHYHQLRCKTGTFEILLP